MTVVSSTGEEISLATEQAIVDRIPDDLLRAFKTTHPRDASLLRGQGLRAGVFEVEEVFRPTFSCPVSPELAAAAQGAQRVALAAVPAEYAAGNTCVTPLDRCSPRRGSSSNSRTTRRGSCRLR